MRLLTLVRKKKGETFTGPLCGPSLPFSPTGCTSSAHLTAGNVVQFIEPQANSVYLLSGFSPVYGAKLASSRSAFLRKLSRAGEQQGSRLEKGGMVHPAVVRLDQLTIS